MKMRAANGDHRTDASTNHPSTDPYQQCQRPSARPDRILYNISSLATKEINHARRYLLPLRGTGISSIEDDDRLGIEKHPRPPPEALPTHGARDS